MTRSLKPRLFRKFPHRKYVFKPFQRIGGQNISKTAFWPVRNNAQNRNLFGHIGDDMRCIPDVSHEIPAFINKVIGRKRGDYGISVKPFEVQKRKDHSWTRVAVEWLYEYV